MIDNLSTLITATRTRKDAQLAHDIKMFLWTTYDPDNSLTYPTISNWDDLLAETIKNDDCISLNKDETLSILFGLIHRNRVAEGLWWSMFERGITQKLLTQLLTLDADKY